MLKAMPMRNVFRAAITLLALCAALPALADTQFRVRRMTRTDVPLGKGQCDIRVTVDGEAEISVRGDTVFVRTLSGREVRDAGSECNEPMPGRNIEGFNFRGVDGRGEVRLLAEPSPRNNFAAVVRIRDNASGEEGYTFRLTWQMTGTSMGRGNSGLPPALPPNDNSGRGYGRGGPGFGNNGMSFNAVGRGSSVLSAYGSQRLTQVSVDIDRGGKIVVSFQGETERRLTFNGTVIGQEDGRMRAEVTTEDRRMHGPMYLTVSPRREVESIEFDGADGPYRLRVNWDRR
jgi:hypothetical protein